MAVYGRGQMLGSTIDPKLMQVDYTPFVNAAAIQGKGMADLGANIAKGIQNYQEGKKEASKLSAITKATSAKIDSAINLYGDRIPGLKEWGESQKAAIADPNTSLYEQASRAQLLSADIESILDRDMKQREFGLREAGLGLEAQGLQLRAGEMMAGREAAVQRAQTEARKRTEGEISMFDPEINRERKLKVWKDEFGNSYDWDTKQPIIDTEKYFYGEEGALGELPPTSQVSDGISNALSMASTPNVSVSSSIPTVNIPYKGVPAPNRYNNPGGAYPKKDFLKFGMQGKGIIGGGHPIGYYPNVESGIAANMAHFEQMNPVGKTIGQMRYYWTKGKRDGSTPMAGMNENEVITREKLNDPNWMGQWMRSTAQGEGFRGDLTDEQLASGFKFYQQGGAQSKGQQQTAAQQITRAGDIIPEMGMNSAQQAEVARQIESGAGMATAQAGGGVSTEPSINQQPQLPQRRMVRGVPVAGAAQKQGSVMSPQQVQELIGQGFKISAVPREDGTFFVTGATGGGAGGMETVTSVSPEGVTTITQRPSGKVSGKVEKAEEAQKAMAQVATSSILGSAASVLPRLDELSANPVIAAARGAVAENAPASVVGQIRNDLETIKTQVSKESINQLRASSPTGSAGGTITEKEWPIFQNKFGQLDIGMAPDQLRSNLQKTALNQFEAVNGTPDKVIQLFKDGKISKTDLENYISEYKNVRGALMIPETGIQGQLNQWTMYNKELDKYAPKDKNQMAPEAGDNLKRLDEILKMGTPAR